MGKIKTFELKNPLLKEIEDYIEKNGYTFSEFIRTCVRSFFFKIKQPEKPRKKTKRKKVNPVKKPSPSREIGSFYFNEY